jgi:predicted dehydrogenase/threonine dehydrogenase-like Zn-dependent dehydrogenase
MRQILQNLRSGATVLEEIPAPRVRPGHLLIATTNTLISSGTERMLVEFGRAGLIEKARQQPDKVRMVLDKIRTDGLTATLQSVRSKLDQPLALGYCSVGRVREVGAGVGGFCVGDRVASNGKHAELVCVPQNLCARVPEAVADEAAAFTIVGAIALQGVRLVAPTLGETVVVTGLGLIGLLTVQLLRAQGCRVLGLDFECERLALAQQFGAEVVDLRSGADPVAAAMSYSRTRGADAVILTASTSSSEPMHQAALMCRKRGRIVLVGVTGLELSREDFYEKELTFQVSCSYGPGRYDSRYEEAGQDYPVGFVRWTEQRNFEAVLDLLADGRLRVSPLITHRYPLERAAEAYTLLGERVPSLGIILEYQARGTSLASNAASGAPAADTRRRLALPSADAAADAGVLGFIGSGSYATQVLIPAFRQTGARLKAVVSNTGVSAVHAARRYAVEEAGTDPEALLSDPEIEGLVIGTRHDSHAGYVIAAVQAGKHVFVEKPLCVSHGQLVAVRDACTRAGVGSSGGPVLTVGFNRRFAPHSVRVKGLLQTVREPKVFVMTVNAGPIPFGHWSQDRDSGGGRIIGEACHFIDLLRFLAGSSVIGFNASRVAGDPATSLDKASFTLTFADGSIGTIHYTANGHRSFPKERLEVFCGGRILQLDNFRRLRSWGWPRLPRLSSWRQDKGQRACALAFVAAVRGAAPVPIPTEELFEVAQLTLDIDSSLRGTA